MAEREAVSRLHLAVLTSLVERLQSYPADALAYARALTVADPLAESGHAAVVRLLAREGRNQDALDQYEHASRVIEAELGVRPSTELEEAWRNSAPHCVSQRRGCTALHGLRVSLQCQGLHPPRPLSAAKPSGP